MRILCTLIITCAFSESTDEEGTCTSDMMTSDSDGLNQHLAEEHDEENTSSAAWSTKSSKEHNMSKRKKWESQEDAKSTVMHGEG